MEETADPGSSGTGDAGLELDLEAESKLRRLFLGSAILSFLIVVYLIFLGIWQTHSALIRVLYLPVLFWSLIITVYAFRCVWDVSRSRAHLLDEMMKRDSLTGAYSDAYFRRQLREERLRSLDSGKESAFVFVKLLGMDRVVSGYGHTVGNIIVRNVARMLMDDVGAECVVARLGGHDFAVLMPETPLSEARQVMDQIWHRISEFRLDLGERGEIRGVDASIGITAYPCEADQTAEITQAVQFVSAQRRPEPGVHVAGESQARPAPSAGGGQ